MKRSRLLLLLTLLVPGLAVAQEPSNRTPFESLEQIVAHYGELIADNPFAADNPSHQHEIITAYQKRDRFDEASAEITKLVEVYGRDGRWARKNQDNKEANRESERLIELNLYDVALEKHQQALKQRSANLLKLAESNYAAYLDYFPTGHRSYDARYWYAEVLYKLNRFEQATDEYERVVALDARGKWLKNAAENQIFAIEKVLKPIKGKLDAAAKKSLRELQRSGTGVGKYAEIELHPWEQRLVKACDSYAKALPDDKKSQAFLYKAALLLHDRNHLHESNPRFLKIVRANPKSEMAQYGVHEILESYNRIEDWQGLATAAREFYAHPDIGQSEKFKAELKNIYQRATFKIAEGFVESDKFSEGAGAFERFYREFGDSELRDLALYNAAYFFGKAGNVEKMVELRLEFLDTVLEPFGIHTKNMMLWESNLHALGIHYRGSGEVERANLYLRRACAEGYAESCELLGE